MKKLILICILLLTSSNIFAQKKFVDYSLFYKKELSNFIDTMKTFFTPNSFNYIVFVTRFREEPENPFCFTLGYILNSASLDEIGSNYYLILDNQLIIIRIDPDKNISLIKELKLLEMDDASKERIRTKLFPSDDGGFTYIGQGLTACFNKRHETKFFHNEDEILIDKSIYTKVPFGINVKLIEDQKSRKKR
jgi:hypothetical protein